MTTTRTAAHGILLGLIVAAASLILQAGLLPGQGLFMPEHTAPVDLQAQVQYDEAMDQCEALPAGTLPGAAVIDWADDRPTTYTEDHAEVSLAFKRALGERRAPSISALTLCR